MVARFQRAYNASLEWAYSNAQAVQWFAEGLNIDPALGQRVRDQFYPKAAMQPDPVIGLDATLKQAVDLKRLPASTTLAQAQAVVEIPKTQ